MRCLAFAALLALPVGLSAQTLGTVDFPTSAKAAAKAPFLRGILLLHSFEYEDAARAFREAQTAEPGFALAYWGEAMTYTHPLWNQQDLPAGRAALERLAPTAEARRAKAKTARERGFLATAEALYFADAGKPKRDSLCAEAFGQLMRDNPGDDEPKAFYALWLMGLSQGVRNIPTYMRAGALAMEVYRHNPRHPGALHYIIHAFDDPIHAPLGLFAAREYSRIAVGADHAQHMTTHIFLALGMWEETVLQNAIASGPDTATWRPGHYTAWLDYGLLQQGKYDDARHILDVTRANVGSPVTAGRASYLLTMRAHYLIGTGRWTDAATQWPLDTAMATTGPKAMDAYALGVAQLAQGNRGAADSALARLSQLARTDQSDNVYGSNAKLPDILATQLRARLAWDAGDHESAITILREASASEDQLPLEFGPPDIVKPTHELLGEFLLGADQPALAQREFGRALELAPGRSASLLGLARAARAAGDEAAAGRALDQLERNWNGADRDLADLTELHRLRASRSTTPP
jgi:tetratricopeptide (TPR) repeat protein